MECLYCGETHVLVADLCIAAMREFAEQLPDENCFVCGDTHKQGEMDMCNKCLQNSCVKPECQGQCLCSFEDTLLLPS
jgi:hypothetical protein